MGNFGTDEAGLLAVLQLHIHVGMEKFATISQIFPT